jgi:uncharacterized protein YceH (UPF0502 family)
LRLGGLSWAGDGDPDACYGHAMKDMKAQLEKLLIQAEECALISKLATDPAKRELFATLAEHHRVLAGEVQRAITKAERGTS